MFQNRNASSRAKPSNNKYDLTKARTKLVAIVGPTATGKTALAISIANKYGGEIICADSRTIYRGMDIGTAKPTAVEKAEVPHHLLDIAEPYQRYSAAEFRDQALQMMHKIQQKGRLPILVGGSGLYAYSLLYDYQFPAGGRNRLREELEKLPLHDLVDRLKSEDPEAAETVDLNNSRRVIRAIETIGLPKNKSPQLREHTLLLGLAPDKKVIQNRIEVRTREMLSKGIIKETKQLIKQFGPSIEALNTVGYAEVLEYLNGQISLEEAEQLINLHSLQLARRQMTWFKRNREIIWLQGSDSQSTKREALAITKEFLDN